MTMTTVNPDAARAGRADSESVSAARIAAAKRAFTTRRVNLATATCLLTGGITPRAGDLVLARVTRVGQHGGLQLPTGRRATLFVGDEIIVCYGNRYAPDQFEARVPASLGSCHLVAGGGIAAVARVWHSRMRRPTEIDVLGLLADSDRRPLNVALAKLAEEPAAQLHPARVIAVVGTAMNAGKTTAAAHLIRGLRAAGLSVGAAKVTGTGAAGDVSLMGDAGASPVVDFTDFGLASTYRVPSVELERVLRASVGHVSSAGADIVVIEVADGLYQAETAALIKSATFRRLVAGVVFAASDALSAAAGVEWLEQRGVPVLAVSGTLTASPLAVEEASAACKLPVLDLGALANPASAAGLLADAQSRLQVRGLAP